MLVVLSIAANSYFNRGTYEEGALFQLTTTGPSAGSTKKSILFPEDNIAPKLADIPLLRLCTTTAIGDGCVRSTRREEFITCKDLWRKNRKGDDDNQQHCGPVLLLLMRRFGCPLCRMLAMNFAALKPYFDAKNVKMVGVGCEKIGYEAFMEGEYFRGGEVLIDAPRNTYRAVGASTVSPWLLYGIIGRNSEIPFLARVSYRNLYSFNFEGDKTVNGGTFVIAAGGEKTLFSHLQDKTAMEPDMRKLMQSIGYTDADMPKDLYPAHNIDLLCLRDDICDFI